MLKPLCRVESTGDDMALCFGDKELLVLGARLSSVSIAGGMPPVVEFVFLADDPKLSMGLVLGQSSLQEAIKYFSTCGVELETGDLEPKARCLGCK